jgi:hypothetical protein
VLARAEKLKELPADVVDALHCFQAKSGFRLGIGSARMNAKR